MTSVFNCPEFGEELISRLTESDFNNEQDFLCVAGSMITLVVSVGAMIAKYKTINVLFFNATIGHYVKRTLGNGQDNTDIR